jgi:DNA (cytosine-5)-methyltransferase 1
VRTVRKGRAGAGREDGGEPALRTVRVAQKKDSALFTTLDRSRLMSRVRQTNTAAEKAIRQLVHSLGYRFRVNGEGLPGRPDLVNRRALWAVFVHGCYWHAHKGCHLWKVPANNRPFWEKKFADNRDRDQRKLAELEGLGYRVLVIWQCELVDRNALTIKLLNFLETHPNGGLSESYRFIPETRRVSRTISIGATVATTLQEILLVSGETDACSAFDRAYLSGCPRVLPEPHDSLIRVADLFCGCGGLTLGIQEACWALGRPFEAALAVDHDPWALGVYRNNFSPLRAFGEDLEALLDGELGEPSSARERRWLQTVGPLDFLVAGPPCQGHSDLNNQTRRSDPRNRLYEKVGRFVEIVRPTHVLIENVPGVVHDRAGVLARTAQHLRELGYNVDAATVDLARLGVPQRRKRHVLVASLAGFIRIESVLAKHEHPLRNLEWAIRDLEHRKGGGLLDTSSRPSAENLKRIHFLLENNEYDLPNSLRPVCHQNDVHSYKSMYGRMSWSEPAQTITSGFGSPGQGRFVHPAQPRTLTPREAARLQFFPDSFSFDGVEKRTQLAQLIGNAVPMKLSWVFGLELMALDVARKSHLTAHP